MSPPRLLLYEPYRGGHQAEYLTWLVRAWLDRGETEPLAVAAQPEILQTPCLRQACLDGGTTVRIFPLDFVDDATREAFVRLRPLRRAIGTLAPTDVLAMTFEHFLAALALRLPLRTRLSAILFRPSFHYAALGDPPESTTDWVRRRARRAMLQSALNHPALDTLFSLDPMAVPSLRRLGTSARILPLPDPAAPLVSPTPRIREQYGIDVDRTLIVLPGDLDARKGTLTLLEALLALPDSIAAQLSVVLAGRLHVGVAEAVPSLRQRVELATRVQLILHDGFVSEADLAGLFAEAAAIVLPYQNHVGSSGFLVRGAAAGTPILTQSYGLMGHLTRMHGLGRTLDTRSPEALAQGIAETVHDPRSGFDPAAAAAFAASRTVPRFTDTLLQAMLDR